MKTAIITGASSGIGTATADMLTKEGWNVIGLYHTSRPTAQFTKLYKIDLSDLDATAQLGAQMAQEYASIDAFIHVAGLWHDERSVLADKQLEKFRPAQIAATLNVGVTSTMILCSQLLPALKKGTVIGISGTFSSASGWLPYFVSKRALEDFLVGLGEDHKDIDVFGVSPADTLTPAYQKFYPEYANESQPVEIITETISRLLSGKSPYKSGDIIEVRDGETRKGYHV